MDLDPEEVTHSGRLGPGQMLVVDLVNHKVYEDEALLELFDAGATYARLDGGYSACSASSALECLIRLRWLLRRRGLGTRAKT